MLMQSIRQLKKVESLLRNFLLNVKQNIASFQCLIFNIFFFVGILYSSYPCGPL